MPFKDYDDFAEGPIEVPFRGKTYTIPQPDLDTGLRLNRLVTDEAESEMPVDELWKLILGPLLDEFRADSVPIAFVGRVAMTALADFLHGRAVAEMAWETGNDPKAVEKYVATLQETMEIPPSSPSTAPATSTRRRASTSSTTSPKASTSPGRKASAGKN